MNKNIHSTTKKLLQNNKFVLLISVVLAIIFWVVINATAAPESENTITGIAVNIPIENSVAGELGLDIIGEIETVSAKVTGPTYVIGGIKAEDIVVTANLSNVTEAGKFTLDLRASKKNSSVSSEYEIVSVSPSSIGVTFDYIDTKKFTVIAKANGASAVEGLSAEDAIVTNASNSEISIKGARTELEKISKVVASAEVNSVLSKTGTFVANLLLYDKDDNALDQKNYTILGSDNAPIDKFEITVPIFKEKEVPVKAQFTNLPKAYTENPIAHNLSSKTILIKGQPEAVELITSISLAPIDFDLISNDNYIFEQAPVLPDGIKCVENVESITVTMDAVKNYTVKTFDVNAIAVTGGSSNVTLVRAIKNVKIVGPKSVMKSVAASTLYAEVDATGKEAGQHTVVVRIRCKTNDGVWQVGTYTATILVK